MRDQCIYASCPATRGGDGGEIPTGMDCKFCVERVTFDRGLNNPRPDGCVHDMMRSKSDCICVPFDAPDPAPVDQPSSAKWHRSGLHLVTPADDYADAPSSSPGSPRQPGIIRMLEDWLRYTRGGDVEACFIVSTTPTGDFMYAAAGQSLREDAWTLVGGIEVAKQHHIGLLLEGKLRVKPPAGDGDGKES